MGLSPALLIGPFVAAVGLVSVWFVMRHRSVQTKSMYSSRRGQIERKVRAARQRTLAPGSRRERDDAQAAQAFAPPGMEQKGAAPTATWGPTAPPDTAAPSPPQPQVWEVGPTVPPPPPSIPAPKPPPFEPSAPAYSPPAEPAYVAPAEEWNPAPAQPYNPAEPYAPPSFEPTAAPVEPASTPAGAGASWSIVGDSKGAAAEPAPDKKSKKEKQAKTGSWQLASGNAPGEDAEDEIKKPSATLAIAQYAVLVVGLVMVLIGVVVMVANSHVT